MRFWKFERFWKDEDGAVIVETVLWIPFLLIFVLAVLDISLIFMNYARAQRIVHEGNRNFAVGALGSCTELETWLETELRAFIPSADATCTPGGSLVDVNVTMTTGDMDLTGATGLFGGMSISVGGIQKYEYAPSG